MRSSRCYADRDSLKTMASAAIERQQDLFSADRMIADTRAVYAAVQDQNTKGDGVERTRIGFIGAGGIANRHFGVLEQFDDVAIVAVADVDMARATEAAARFGARAFDDAAAMLAAIDLDALYICVPPFAHGEPERLAIEHKLPFFVEKPVALDLGTAEDVAAAVDRLGLVTAVGYHWRYLDTVDEVKALLSATPARLLSGYGSTPRRRHAGGGRRTHRAARCSNRRRTWSISRAISSVTSSASTASRATSTAPPSPVSTSRRPAPRCSPSPAARSPISPRPACSTGTTASACTCSAKASRSSSPTAT